MNENSEYSLHPKDAKAALARWDAGEPITTIEMGGLGPGYEQAIHIGVMELIRKLIDLPLQTGNNELNQQFDDALLEVNREQDLGLSGAQAGAIRNLAFQYLTHPWEEVLKMVGEDRRILVSKRFPGQRP